MKATMTIHLRRFPVQILDERTGIVSTDTIVFDKRSLQAAELKENLITTRRQVERISAALDQMGEYDRMIVERLIINHEKADDLADELFITTRTVFRHRDRALRQFAFAYYGIEA